MGNCNEDSVKITWPQIICYASRSYGCSLENQSNYCYRPVLKSFEELSHFTQDTNDEVL